VVKPARFFISTNLMLLAELYSQAIVETVRRALDGPFFRIRVTDPVALAQLMAKVDPAVTPSKLAAVLVIMTAWATAKAAAAQRALKNCILLIMNVFGSIRMFSLTAIVALGLARVYLQAGKQI